MTTFERIKILAKKHGYTLNSLNEAAGLGARSIYRWETRRPSDESLKKVAKVLGVSVEYLRTGKKDSPSQAIDEAEKYMFAITDYPVRYINSEDRGNPFTAKMLNRSLKNAAKKAGISKKITTHFLRHTYVSKQASYGTVFNYDFIRQIGHADASTTHDIYDHINTINHDDLAKGYHKLDEDIANDNI